MNAEDRAFILGMITATHLITKGELYGDRWKWTDEDIARTVGVGVSIVKTVLETPLEFKFTQAMYKSIKQSVPPKRKQRIVL